MNFPDLKICKAISGEFPNSEFVWVKGYDEPLVRWFCKMPASDDGEVLASAPTCEELGEWLFKNAFKEYDEDHRNILMAATLFDCCKSSNETQARAEAVRLIRTK